MDVAAASASALQTRVLAMTLTDARATIAQVIEQSSPTQQPADVILSLSTAAQQLLKTS
jgi:siroheme synthase